MCFRNVNFTKTLAEEEKVMSPRFYSRISLGICLALASLFVGMSPRMANAQARQIKGYAVQVAALSSRQSADELVRGLSTRGIHAYWVKGMSYGKVSAQSQFHRVRIGNFPTIESASTYAEQLLGSGLLEAYAIAAYEPPAQSSAGANGHSSKVQNFGPQKYPQYRAKQFGGGEAIDLVAAVGTRGWLLLSSSSVNLTARSGDSALSRELARLTASIGSRGWSLQNNITKFLAAPPPPARLPSVNPVGRVDLASNNSFARSAAAEIVTTRNGINSAPSAPPAPRANSGSLNTAAPEIGRSPLSPASSTASGARAANSRAYASPPRLQGSIEMRDGRMWMRLRNTDSERSFSGMARVTLSDDKRQQDVVPMQFTLPPDKEESFPVDEATLTNGNWILMVYDQNGAARLVRGASLAPRTLVEAPAAQNSSEPNSSQGPPSYITGVYDATGWVPSQAPAPNPGVEAQNSAAANSTNGNVSATAPPEMEAAPGQVVVTPRQIAVTTENVTVEFDISAPTPLNYIVVTLRAGSFQDVRQALMSTPHGRVPFLIPIEHTSSGFYFEVKDEAQRLLASGSGDFRRMARGN